ncbi:MAG: hypothetical protein ACOQNV_03190 [Mycoplasmoidaceae bacterium]
MDKKKLQYLGLALVGLVFLFSLIGAFAAHLAMSILAIIFSAGAIVCLVFVVLDRKPKPTVTVAEPTATAEPTAQQ